MIFSEISSVEYFIIHQLSGVNLNHPDRVADINKIYDSFCSYQPASVLKRGVNEVLVESEFVVIFVIV